MSSSSEKESSVSKEETKEEMKEEKKEEMKEAIDTAIELVITSQPQLFKIITACKYKIKDEDLFLVAFNNARSSKKQIKKLSSLRKLTSQYHTNYKINPKGEIEITGGALGVPIEYGQMLDNLYKLVGSLYERAETSESAIVDLQQQLKETKAEVDSLLRQLEAKNNP